MKAAGRKISCLKICMLDLLLSILAVVSTVGRSNTVTEPASRVLSIAEGLLSKDYTNRTNSTLLSTADYGEDPMVGACSKDDIALLQGQGSPLPNGIPTYSVQILNACVAGCSICNIHVSCGWFSSARLIDPNVFRRLCYDDCLVNDGDPLGAGESLSFQYANSFAYPLSVFSVDCC